MTVLVSKTPDSNAIQNCHLVFHIRYASFDHYGHLGSGEDELTRGKEVREERYFVKKATVVIFD